MVSILKKPVDDSKGFLVFTHKEKFIFESENPYICALLEKLKQAYVLGMHWGHFHREVKFKTNLDVHFAGQGTVSFPPDVYHIPLCSRNFIPSCFTPGKEKKIWDILMIARPIKDKNIDSFFRVIKELYKIRPELKVLLISPIPYPDWPKGSFYKNILKDYASLFSEEEKNNFLFLPIAYEEFPFPISIRNLVLFYQRSKVFTLFSTKEGESRVIAEALVCGLPVVARKDLIGGGLDYLNNTNSCLFLTEEEAVKSFDKILHAPLNFDPSFYMQELRADCTEEKFEAEIKKLFKHLHVPFKGELITTDLDKRLPNHYWPNSLDDLDLKTINDLTSLKDFMKFAKFLLGDKKNLNRAPMCFYADEVRSIFRKKILKRLIKILNTFL